jgi:Right handed beta helix region
MKRVLSLFVILFCSLVTFPAWAATHIITTSMVTVTNDSFSPPAQGGDTLIIEAGRTKHIEFAGLTGDSGKPITIKNPSDAKISITETMTAPPSGSITFRTGCRYIVLDGSNYSSETYGIYLQNGYFGIRLHESEDIEIKYIEIRDTLYPGIQWQDGTWTATQDVENIKIHNCYIHDIGTEGIYFGNSSFDPAIHPSFKDCKIYSNIIEDCGWDCIQLGAADEGINEIYKNYCKNCGTDGVTGQTFGIVMGRSSTGDIYQNMVINAYTAGIRLGAITKQCDIHDNVIIDSGTYGIGNASTTPGQTIINNTIVNRDTSVVNCQGIATRAGKDLGEVRCNLVVGTGKAGQISTSYSVNQNNLTSNSISGMYFENADATNFRLTLDSPARDYSSNPRYSTTDYDNNPRPCAGTAPDVGAHEYVPGGGATALQPVNNLRIGG